MQLIEFRQVHKREAGVSVEVWLEYRARLVENNLIQNFGPWIRLDTSQIVDQDGNAL